MHQVNFEFRVMCKEDLAKVLMIEQYSHSNPWTQKNFLDCLDHAYWNYVLQDVVSKHIYGHCIFMPGVSELHLLNITIDHAFRRHGIALRALQAIEKTSIEKAMFKIILEVRTSNCAAIGLYEKLGYQTIGIRKDYYPYQLTTRDSTNAVLQKSSTREDAVVMEKILVR